MQLLGKQVGQVTAAEIEALVSLGVQESLTIEYKRDLPGRSDKDKLEFLADVSAMANSQGGVIIYGIAERKDAEAGNAGLPELVFGVPAKDLAETSERLRNVLLTGLNPILPSPILQTLEVEGKHVLIVGITRSLYAPHAVWVNNNGKFYRRDWFGKRQVAPSELRQMFLEGHEWAEQADLFRKTRVDKVVSGEAGIVLQGKAWAFVHVLPLGRLDTSLPIFERDWRDTARAMCLGQAKDWTANFDGFFSQDALINEPPPSWYTQAFRFGGFEFYTSRLFREEPEGIFLPGVQKFLDLSMDKGLPIMREQWDVEPPYAILLSICLKGNLFGIYQDEMKLVVNAGPVIRQTPLFFPATILSIEDVAKPDRFERLVAMAWQAAGHPGPGTPNC